MVGAPPGLFWRVAVLVESLLHALPQTREALVDCCTRFQTERPEHHRRCYFADSLSSLGGPARGLLLDVALAISFVPVSAILFPCRPQNQDSLLVEDNHTVVPAGSPQPGIEHPTPISGTLRHP